MIVLDLSFSVLILNFSGLKSSKLTKFAGVAHNVLSILNFLYVLKDSFYILYIIFSKSKFLRMYNYLNKFLGNIHYFFNNASNIY